MIVTTRAPASPDPIWARFAPDRDDPRSLCDQLVASLREAIARGLLAPGTRLPASRALARDFGLARNTVATAYDRLLAEGYLEARVGAGTFVAGDLGVAGDFGVTTSVHKESGQANVPAPSKRGRKLLAAANHARHPHPLALEPGVPALDAFPFELWARTSARFWRRRPANLLGYGAPAGFIPLRRALAAYLRVYRGLACTPEQVIVVPGSQAGIAAVARVLLDPGDPVWVEEPGYAAGRMALVGALAKLQPVPVDDGGLDVAAGERSAPDAKLVLVAPSHQYPLGVTLAPRRRIALLAWARSRGAWILEDDYDGEFRHIGRPVSALHALDPDGRVLYLGTLSKVLAPALRLGYLVVPDALVDAFAAERAASDRHVPTAAQAVAASFIEGGHLATHVRRLRGLFAERRTALLEALATRAAGVLHPGRCEAGLHLAAELPPGSDDMSIALRAAAEGVGPRPLSAFHLRTPVRPGLVLGFGNTSPERIDGAVQVLLRALARQRHA